MTTRDVLARIEIADYRGNPTMLGYDNADSVIADLTAAGLVILPRAVVMEAVEAMDGLHSWCWGYESVIKNEMALPILDRTSVARVKLMEAVRDE